MNQPEDELSLDEIDSIMAQSEPTRTPRAPKKDDRSVTAWFKSYHIISGERPCEVAKHDESRPRNKGMVTIVNDKAICRVCFLNQLDHE